MNKNRYQLTFFYTSKSGRKGYIERTFRTAEEANAYKQVCENDTRCYRITLTDMQPHR
jgi:hypothetical protein